LTNSQTIKLNKNTSNEKYFQQTPDIIHPIATFYLQKQRASVFLSLVFHLLIF
jgi:hypothetical protein